MIHHYDHRWATYTPEGDTRDLTLAEKRRPDFAPLPRYWDEARHVAAALAGRWKKEWLLGFRDICRSTDERTVIAGIFPRMAIGNNLPLLLMQFDDASLAACSAGSLTSFACDFAARFKVGGTHLNFYRSAIPILPKHLFLPAPGPERVRPAAPPSATGSPASSSSSTPPMTCPLRPRLHATARPSNGTKSALSTPLRARRRFFHLYLGTQSGASKHIRAARLLPHPRDAVVYILDTFPIVKRKDEQNYGEFRTQRNIVFI